MSKVVAFTSITLDGVVQLPATRRGSPGRFRVRRLGSHADEMMVEVAAEGLPGAGPERTARIE